MKRFSGGTKQAFVYYSSILALLLLLGIIGFTISTALQQQRLSSKAAVSVAAALPPGAALPSEAECATRVVKTPENVLENQQANSTNVYASGYRLSGSLLGQYGANYEGKVTGNFTGTTDEILQWGACKWGFDADTARAIAFTFTKWKQSTLAECNNQGPIQPETNGCQSVGIMRIKAATIPPVHPGTWPYAKTSTAFNVDYVMATLRACFDGKQTALGAGYAAGDEAGCIGAWHSGAWHDGASEGFSLTVLDVKAKKEWTTLGTPANPSAPIANPSFGGIFTCPGNPACPSPATSPVVISTQPNPSGSVVVPSGASSNPVPSSAPCETTGASLATKKKSKHKEHKGGISGFMEALLKFFIELLNLILKLFGGGQIPNPNPLPQPSGIPNPSTMPNPLPCPEPSNVPSEQPEPSISGVPSLGVSPSVLPSQATSITPSQPPAGGTSPSGQAMPMGDIPGWKLVFSDDFTKDAPLGSWANTCTGTTPAAANARIVYTGAQGQQWKSYPDCFTDTYQKRPYRSDQVLSVKNGVLNFYLHPVNGQPAGANPSPVIVGNSQYQTYGRYVARFKVDSPSLSEYYAAWLLWPQSEKWGPGGDGEIDFPEGHLNGTVGGFHHCLSDTSKNCAQANTGGAKFIEWHTYVQEWTPNYVKFTLDGKEVLNYTNKAEIPNKPMRWQLQTETNGNGSNQGNLMLDWVTVYSYQP